MVRLAVVLVALAVQGSLAVGTDPFTPMPPIGEVPPGFPGLSKN